MSVGGKSIFYILIGIKLLSLSMSILYLHLSVFWLLLVFTFAIITDLILWKCKIFDPTMSDSCVAPSLSLSSWHIS